MKHLSHRFLLLAGLTLALTAMVSCKKDSSSNAVDAKATVTFTQSVTDQFADIYDVYVDYNINYDGQDHKQTDVRVATMQPVTDISCPCTIDVQMKFKQIADIDTTIRYSGKLYANVEVKTNTSNPLMSNGQNRDQEGFLGSRLADFVTSVNKLLHYKYSIDENGKITRLDQ